MSFEEITIQKEKIFDRGKIEKIIRDFCVKKGYLIGDPEKCKNNCQNWNQQIGLELMYNHGINTRMLNVVKKDFSSNFKHAVEDDVAHHCFVEIIGDDIFIDVTPRQFESNSDDILFLSKDEIMKQDWVEN